MSALGKSLIGTTACYQGRRVIVVQAWPRPSLGMWTTLELTDEPPAEGEPPKGSRIPEARWEDLREVVMPSAVHSEPRSKLRVAIAG